MYQHSIKEWSVNDRPREKFISKGKEALSDSELLAILIRSGTRDRSALAVSQEILQLSENNLSALAKMHLQDLMKVKGIGSTKAVTIMTALELGRRRRLSEAVNRVKINTSNDAYDLIAPLLEDLTTEQFWVIYLNNANKVLCKEQISAGGMTATIVDIRLILKRALELNSTALVLCHNHPSGTLEPSKADVDVTHKMKKAASYMDIQVLDHLIVSDIAYFSFADQGRL
jgi:DNA repair protein RadC